MANHYTVEYPSDISLEELEVGDTITATLGFDRENPLPDEMVVTWKIFKGEEK